MADLYRQIASDHSPIQQLMMRLPGFRGYQESTDRRAADRLLREHVVTALKEQLAAYVAAQKSALNNTGGLSYMSKLHDVQSQFQVLIDRIGAAMPGYAGFYDALKIHPNDLQKLYTFDAAMLDYVDKFKAAVEAIATAVRTNEGLDASIAALGTLISEASATFSQRESALTGLK